MFSITYFFVSLVYLCRFTHAMFFTYSANPTVGQDLTVTWNRDPSETAQFTLVLVNDQDQSVQHQSVDVSVPTDQRTGTVHFVPTAAGDSRVEQMPFKDPTAGSPTGSGPEVDIAAAPDGSSNPPPPAHTTTTSGNNNAATSSSSSTNTQQTSPSVGEPQDQSSSRTGSSSDGSSGTTTKGVFTLPPEGLSYSSRSVGDNSPTGVAGESFTMGGQVATSSGSYFSSGIPSTTSPSPSPSTTGSGSVTSGGLSTNKLVAIVVSVIVILVLAVMFFVLFLRRRRHRQQTVDAGQNFFPEMMVRRHNPALYFQPPGTLSAGSFKYQTPQAGASGAVTATSGTSHLDFVSKSTLGSGPSTNYNVSVVSDTLESTSVAPHVGTPSPPHFPSPRSLSPPDTEPYHDPYDDMAEVIYSTPWPGQAQTHDNDLRSWTFPRTVPPLNNSLQNIKNIDSNSQSASDGHGMSIQ